MSVARWPGTRYGPTIEIGYPLAGDDLPCEYVWDCGVWGGELPEVPTFTDVLFEPFDNLSAWTQRGTPTIVAGRTGTAVSCVATTAGVDYLFTADASEYVTVGFAWRTNTTSATQRTVAEVWSQNNAQRSLLLRYNGTTARTFSLYREIVSGSPIGTSTMQLVPVNTWAYIEIKAYLQDTTGSAEVRVNGVPVITATNIDTRPTSLDLGYDALRLITAASGHTNLWDDLYLTTGPGASYKGDITLPLADVREPVENPGRWGPPWDWRNVECDVRAGSNIVRGSSSPSQRASSSTCSLSITPRDNTLAPWWVDPVTGERPNRANLPLRVGVVDVLDEDVGVGVRVSEDGTARTLEDLAGRRSEAATPVAASTTTWWLFTGWVDYITEVDGVDELSLTVVASDGWKHLSLLEQAEVAPVGAGEAAGARIGRILERAEWANPSDLSLGTFALQATTLARPALEEIFLTADTEAGVVWVDASGTFRFGDRDWLASKSARTDWRIGDRHDDPDAICASSIVTTADDMDIQNVIGVARVGGVASWTEDPDSIARYGRHSWSRFDLPYASDDDTPTILALQLGDRTARDFHAQAVVLAPLSEPDAWECVLGVDLYDTVYLTRRRGDDRRAELGGVIGVDHSFGPNEFVTVLSLGPPLRQTLAVWDVDVWDTARWSGN